MSKKFYKFEKPKAKDIDLMKNRFSELVYEKRIALGLSQQSLADLIGVDRKTINRIENGHFSPNLDTMLRMVIVLKLSSKQIFEV